MGRAVLLQQLLKFMFELTWIIIFLTQAVYSIYFVDI